MMLPLVLLIKFVLLLIIFLISLLICWSPIGDFRQNIGRQIFFSLAIATKRVAAWSAEFMTQPCYFPARVFLKHKSKMTDDIVAFLNSTGELNVDGKYLTRF